ncbi:MULTISPECIES: GntR family transcriptional regulator [Micromonospora]|uniref:GntR family transcriptional regulator n=1 Tax=Micromonospora TaxID=1873 RepID=UPI0003EED6E2|nr:MULTISPECIES: GntR family transcriptional regulator [Micromonospora]EWM64937.1 transcriptional regulator, GntR family [Micromonospora sp. M42]MBC8989823.1 GntR family transcriptional regulator [Micromonospora chalcea]MBP1782104.1 DNA-binding GntR family transcriptional regulator [Micromonospora sp. HB375]MBQ1062610.1 GntR family transcriptional regulator [Micromonospora sp. C41]MCK1804731.1 GntR family transcriptional regulator [Micromonospora sp. R42106]
MTNAGQDAYEALRSAILNGSIRPGERLGEVELSSQFGVSRTPIREALRRLTAEGLVVFQPNRGARVAEWSLSDLEDTYEIRARLESYGAALAAQRIDADCLPRLSLLCDEMDQRAQRMTPQDLDDIADLNAELHGLVIGAADSPRLTSLLSAVVEVPLVVRAFRLYTPEALARSMAHHRDLVAALRARDAEWASSTMRAHVLAARRVLLDAMSDNPDL